MTNPLEDQVTRISNNIASAYTICNNKGATMPATQNSANLANCISSITAGGSIESLTLTSTTSQQVVEATGSVGGYSPVTVNAVTASIDSNITAGNIKNGVNILGVTGTYTGSSGIKYGATVDSLLGDVDSNGVLQIPTGSADLVFTGVENIAGSVLYYKFYNCTNIESISFPSLTTVSDGSAMYYAFSGCTGITSVSFPVLTTVSGGRAMVGAFNDCTGITSVNLSALTTVSGSNAMNSAFVGRLGNMSLLTSVSFPSLSVLTGLQALAYCFRYRNGLRTVSFPALTSTSFGSYTNQFDNMLSGVTGCTVHFPSNLQSVIGSWTSVTNGFGGRSTTVLFDLPATT